MILRGAILGFTIRAMSDGIDSAPEVLEPTSGTSGRKAWTSRSRKRIHEARRALELGPLGQGRPDRHAQPHHAAGHRRRRQAGQEGQGLRARHPARLERPADRPVRRPLEPDPHHAGDRHRRRRRPAGLEQDPLRRRRHQHAASRAPRTGMRSATSSTRTRCITATTPSSSTRAACKARHRALARQDDRPRRAARRCPLHKASTGCTTATASPMTSSTPAPRRRA